MKLKILPNLELNKNFAGGQVVEVDKIGYDKSFSSGIKVRVIGVWRTPRWFDLGWFIKLPLDFGSKL